MIYMKPRRHRLKIMLYFHHLHSFASIVHCVDGHYWVRLGEDVSINQVLAGYVQLHLA